MNQFGQKYGNDRTEDEIMAQAPIRVKFGTEDYNIAPLTILKNREWRAKLADLLNELFTPMQHDVNNMDSFMSGLMVALMAFPERVLDLVLAYAPALPRDTIENNATEEQVVVAFSRIMAVAYPFFGLLGTMRTVASAAGQATGRP